MCACFFIFFSSQATDDRPSFEKAWQHSCKFLIKHFKKNPEYGKSISSSLSSSSNSTELYFKKETAAAWKSALTSLNKDDFQALLYIPVRTRYDSKVPKQTLEDLYTELSKDSTEWTGKMLENGQK